MAASGGKGGSSKAIEAGRAFVRINGDAAGLAKVLKWIPQQFKAVGKMIAGVGTGIAAVGAGVLAPLAAMSNYFVDAGSAATDMASRLNTSTETVTALAYAAEMAGGSMEDVEANVGKLQQKIVAGAEKGDAFFAGLIGQDVDTQLAAVADRIAAIEDPTKQAAAAIEFFGKSGRKMLPFLKDGAAGLSRLRQQAMEDGAIIGTEEADKADRIGDAIGRVSTVIKSVFRAIGGALLPDASTAEQFAQAISNTGQSIRAFLTENAELIKIVGLVAGGMLIGGTALTAFGLGVAGAATGVTALVSILGAVLSPIGLIVTGVAAISAGLALMVADSEEFGTLWAEMSGIFGTAFKGIKDAFAGGDLSLAMNIAWAGLKLGFSKLVGELEAIWVSFKYGFYNGWEDISEAGELAWDFIKDTGKAAVNGLIWVINQLIDGFNTFIEGVNWAMSQLPGGSSLQIGRFDNIAGIAREADIYGKTLEKYRNIRSGLAADERTEIDAARATDAALAEELYGLTRLAEDKANRPAAEMDGSSWDAFKRLALRSVPTRQEIGESVKGLFGGSLLNSALGLGDNRTVPKLLERSAEANEEVAEIMRNGNPLVWEA